MTNWFQKLSQKTLGKVLNKSLDAFGNQMKKTSVSFQFQSALIAYTFLWLSCIFGFFYKLYTMFHFAAGWGWELFYALNALCGVAIIYSMLVSTFMSYLQIKAIEEANKLMANISLEPSEVNNGI